MDVAVDFLVTGKFTEPPSRKNVVRMQFQRGIGFLMLVVCLVAYITIAIVNRGNLDDTGALALIGIIGIWLMFAHEYLFGSKDYGN